MCRERGGYVLCVMCGVSVDFLNDMRGLWSCQDQAEKQWWALRFGAGASGFIIDSALLEQHHHAAEPTSQAYQSVLLVASKRDATVHCLASVLNRYGAGTNRTIR